MQSFGDPPSEIVDEMSGGLEGLLPGGSSGRAAGGAAEAGSGSGGSMPGGGDGADPGDIGNFELPADFAAGLPKELQEQCVVQ